MISHVAGRCGLVRLRPLLTQHFLGCAAAPILRRSGFHYRGHCEDQKFSIPKPPFRRAGL
jgi:hypothetical protein